MPRTDLHWIMVAVAIVTACSTAKVKALQPGANKNAGTSAISDGTISTTNIGGRDGSVDSVGAFEKTVQPLAAKWCGSCHGAAQSPLFASSDGKASHDAIIATSKVDFDNVDKSRLVLRLSVDKHNCPADPGCEESAKQMQTAIQLWADAIKSAAKTDAAAITSDALHLSDAQTQTVLGVNPDGVLAYFAPQMKATAPMVATQDTASGNAVINSPIKGTSDTNPATAVTNKNLGTATFTADVVADGTFKITGLVNGPTATSSSFYIRIDNGALNPWVFKTNAAAYTWEAVTPTAGGAVMTFPLKAGAHTIEVRQREAGAQLARVVMYSIPKFDPAIAQATSRQAKQIRFDLSSQSKIAGAMLALEVEDYATNAYLFRNPSLIVPTGNIHAKDLRVLINNVFLPQNATFTVVDKTLAAPGGQLSTAAMIAVKDQGVDKDAFSVSFGTFEAK